MSLCDHVSWLQIAGSKDLTISDTSRLRNVLQELPKPHVQTPSLAFFQGKSGGVKDTALRYLFRYNNAKRNRISGVANIRVDNSTVHNNCPLLFADGNINFTLPPKQSPSCCHQTTTYPIIWPCPNVQMALDLLHTRVILPLCSVFIIFADDFESGDQILAQLVRWSTLNIFSSLPENTHPSLILVYSTSNNTYGQQAMRNIGTNDYVRAMFPSITVIPLNDNLSLPARFLPLKEQISKYIDLAMNARRRSCWLFSATHLEALYQACLRHMTQTITEAFDPVMATRTYIIHDGPVQEHLQNFIQLGVKYVTTYEDITTYIASSLFMDAYPPGSHLFAPKPLFRKLYKNSCLGALKAIYTGDLAERQLHRVEEKFCLNFRTLQQLYMENESVSSADLHISNARSGSIIWRTVSSDESCLYCLVRMSQHPLSCGHSVCDTCVKIFGNGIVGAEYRFTISECMLCMSGRLGNALIKPPTCGVRILAIDGGGTRGVVPLENLLLLQEILGPECMLQDLFDFSVGTSSGGLINLDLCLSRRTISNSSQTFDSIVRKYFSQQKFGKSIGARVKKLVKAWKSDGYYDATDLESCLKETFGIRRMFENPGSEPSGKKVAVVTTSVLTGEACVFSNYNAYGTDFGYKREKEVYAWEAARATSAAPILFPQVNLTMGTFGDGGLSHNNPIKIGLSEIKHIWPENSLPDVVLSLGTATSDPQSPLTLRFLPKWMLSLCSSFLSSIDGENIWRDILNRLDKNEKQDYFRLNIRVGQAPEMDDITQMDDLRRAVHFQPLGKSEREEVVSALLISSFYLELDCIPSYENDYYRCEGVIRCRDNSRAIVQALGRLFSSPLEFTRDTGSLAAFKGEEDICRWCQRYSKRVVFYVRHPTDSITIFLRTDERNYRKLSGFPQSMDWFVKQQKLDAHFGVADHFIPRAFLCSKCDKHRLQNRKRKLYQPLSRPPKRLRQG